MFRCPGRDTRSSDARALSFKLSTTRLWPLTRLTVSDCIAYRRSSAAPSPGLPSITRPQSATVRAHGGSAACSIPTDRLPAHSARLPHCCAGNAAPTGSATRARCLRRPPTGRGALPREPCPPAASAGGFSDRAGSRSVRPPAGGATPPASIPAKRFRVFIQAFSGEYAFGFYRNRDGTYGHIVNELQVFELVIFQ